MFVAFKGGEKQLVIRCCDLIETFYVNLEEIEPLRWNHFCIAIDLVNEWLYIHHNSQVSFSKSYFINISKALNMKSYQ